MRSRWIAGGAALTALLSLACSRDQPEAPGLHSITGHVVLTGFLVDSRGFFAGNRVVGDADGVAVDLLYGNRVSATTTTVDGVYRFTGVPQGGYSARARVVGDIEDVTLPLSIFQTDIAVGDTLRLVSRGDLLPVPNPAIDTTWVYFELPDSGFLDVKVVDLSGRLVRTLASHYARPGLLGVSWDGLDESGVVVTKPLHWVTFAMGSDYRAHLVFR